MGKHVNPRVLERERIRAKIECRIQKWIDALDALDAMTEDLEPELDYDELGAGEEDLADHEPSLGSLCSTNDMGCVPIFGGQRTVCAGSQTAWANSSTSDREETCEDEGSEHDGREDGGDSEPTLGWTGHLNQDEATPVNFERFSDEAEPSLGAPLNHHDQRRWGQGNLRDVELVDCTHAE